MKYYHHVVTIQHDCDGKQSGLVTELVTVCGTSLFLTCTLEQYPLTDNTV